MKARGEIYSRASSTGTASMPTSSAASFLLAFCSSLMKGKAMTSWMEYCFSLAAFIRMTWDGTKMKRARREVRCEDVDREAYVVGEEHDQAVDTHTPATSKR